jgi:exodeoxyribonuclease VII small subunit
MTGWNTTLSHAQDVPNSNVVASLSFEAAMRELEQIVGDLEKGNVDLEKSIELYARGESLKKHCEALLKSAEARIEKIVQGPDGAAKSVAPLDVE